MPHPLLDTDRIHELPGDYVRCIGDVFAEFGTNSQDSGNISYGIRVDGAPFFVKTTGIPGAPLPDTRGPCRPVTKRHHRRGQYHSPCHTDSTQRDRFTYRSDARV